MLQAIRSARPGGHAGYVGVAHGVQLPGQELFFSELHLHGGPAPGRRFLPDLIELPLDQAVEGYRDGRTPCDQDPAGP